MQKWNYKYLRQWSARVVAIIASPTGTALIPTHGSCLPFVKISVSSILVFIVFFEVEIELVGLTQNLTIKS